jgi:hypothetical protein
VPPYKRIDSVRRRPHFLNHDFGIRFVDGMQAANRFFQG